MADQTTSIVPLDKEAVRAYVYERTQRDLPDDDLLWVFVDVMDGTNQALLKRTRNFIRYELKNLVGENRTIFTKDKGTVSTSLTKNLEGEIVRMLKDILGQSLANTSTSSVQTVPQESLVLQEHNDTQLQHIMRWCQYMTVAVLCVGILVVAVILWEIFVRFV